MRIEYKSLFLGIVLGMVSIIVMFFIIGDINTEFSFILDNKNKNQSQNIDITIERIMEDGQDRTDVIVKGNGIVTKEDIDQKLEELFKHYNINEKESNVNIDILLNN